MAKVNALQAFFEAYEKDRLDKSEFTEAMQKLLEQMTKKFDADKKELNEAVVRIAQEFVELKGGLTNEVQTGLSAKGQDVEKRLNKAISEVKEQIKQLLQEQQDGMNFIYDKVSSLQDGKTPIKGVDYFDGKDADPITISQLTENIGTMSQRLEEIEKRPLSVAGGYTPLVRVLYNQTFPETPNGVRTTFSLIKEPKNANGVAIFQNRTRCHLTEDFTISGRTVTFTVAPITDDKLFYDIMY